MIIRVVTASNGVWYSECVNDLFYVFTIDNSPYLHFTKMFIFYRQDVEIIQDVKGELVHFPSKYL